MSEGEQGKTKAEQPRVVAGERPLCVFVSSVMRPQVEDLQWARDEVKRTVEQMPFAVPWAFEYTPASSERVDQGYLRKVREADIVVWLQGSETTPPVANEIREALASDRRIVILRLPADARSSETEALTSEVGLRAKWGTVAERTEDNLAEELRLALGDEIARALRGEPGLGRIERFAELERASIARCVELWLAVGVPVDVAENLANDQDVGALPDSAMPSGTTPLVVLTGDLGAGKSLAVERALQRALHCAKEDGNAAVPIYIDARTFQVPLWDRVMEEAQGLGNPRVHGAFVVIDYADNLDAAQVAEILAGARQLTRSLPNTTVLATMRPRPETARLQERVAIPLLSETQAYALIDRILGINREPGWPPLQGAYLSWPQSVRDALKYPLFAVLLASIYRGDPDTAAPRTPGALLVTLVERALRRAWIDDGEARKVLRDIAASCTDRGGLIPASEVTSGSVLEKLQTSGLLVQRGPAVGFALPTVQQWFAAEYLASDPSQATAIASSPTRLERWFYAFVIAVNTLPYHAVDAILIPVVKTHPAVGSAVVRDSLVSWAWPDDEPIAAPLAEECGERLRTAMVAWVRGIGQLAEPIAPLRSDGSLAAIGTASQGPWVVYSWYAGADSIPDIVPLPQNRVDDVVARAQWPRIRRSRPGGQSAWAWRWTLDDLASRMDSVLSRQDLPVAEGPVVREGAWCEALIVSGKPRGYKRPLPLDTLESGIEGLDDNVTDIATAGHQPRPLRYLRAEIARLRAQGETELPPPWPGPDRQPATPLVWDQYTNDRLRELAELVYGAALESYQTIVTTWLRPLAARLRTSVILPARFEGVLCIPGRDPGVYRPPVLHWYLVPLPSGSTTAMNVTLGDLPNYQTENALGASLWETVRVLRPEAAEWIGATISRPQLDVFGPTPATDLAYSWLRDDLYRIGWCTKRTG